MPWNRKYVNPRGGSGRAALVCFALAGFLMASWIAMENAGKVVDSISELVNKVKPTTVIYDPGFVAPEPERKPPVVNVNVPDRVKFIEEKE